MRGFLDACHEIETLTGQIYRKLAADSSYRDFVREAFRRLASDEQAHARQIDLVRQAPECERQVGKLMSWDKAAECLADAKDFLRMVAGKRLGEKEALKLAVALEERFIKVHAHNALDFTNPRLEDLFRNLAESDQTHLDTLRGCLDRWMRERKAQASPIT